MTITFRLLFHLLILILQLLLKPDAQRQMATEGLAVVSNLMLKYRVIEMTFRSRAGNFKRMLIQQRWSWLLILNARS